MINWYRALLREKPQSPTPAKIRVPTLLLWGQQDPHISYEMAPLSVALCDDGRLVTFEDATHWVMHDKSKEVSQQMVEHFSVKGIKNNG
jgi:pimeloyl-ACP methyl ester carboxylesterase